MNTIPPRPESDENAAPRRLNAALAADRLDPRPKAEFFYKSAAVAQARRDPEPRIPNEVVSAEMERMIAELDQEIATLSGG
jgi:hypothetical protein